MEKIRCPQCKEWTSWKDNLFRPFCSDRCRQIDLGNWATERYRVPAEGEEPSEDALANKPVPTKKPEENE